MVEGLSWSPEVAWVDGEHGVTLALLPDGPVTVLTDADVLLAHMGGSFTIDDLVHRATESGPGRGDEMARGVRRFIESLVDMGFLVASRGSPPSDNGVEDCCREVSQEGLG